MNGWIRRGAALVIVLGSGALACGDGPTAVPGPGSGGAGGGGAGGGGTGGDFRSVEVSSFLGGSDRDDMRGMVVDPQGNVYLVGSTWSADFPVTPGSFDPTFNSTNGSADAVVMKLDPNGNVLWSSFLGGPDLDFGMDVRVDAAGFVYVAGQAGPGFPVTAGALQTVHKGGTNGGRPADGYVCKITPDGSAIVFCTYFGSSEGEVIRSMTIDQAGDIYVAPGSRGQFPQQWFTNALQPTHKADRDIVVARISSDGSRVVWATYLGGAGNESGESIQVGQDGSVYVAFGTNSADMPTAGGFDGTLDGVQDLFVGRIAPGGSALIYGTYVGGSGGEGGESHHLSIAAGGDAFVSSRTTSSDFPTTPGSYQSAFSGGPSGDLFVARLGAAGNLLAATYLGGSDNEGAETIAVDGSGNVFVAGVTMSDDIPTVGSDLLTGTRVMGDVFVAALSPALDSLLLSARVGGSGSDFGRASALDANGSYFVSGHTESPDWPTRNPGQGTYGGGLWDAYVLKFSR